jgi:signal transduction histidine kinase
LRQAGVALHGRVVTLWEITPAAAALPLLSSIPEPKPEDANLDIEKTLRRWGAPVVQKSRWVGCRVAADGPWIIAPVRSRPAAPPPAGIERRSADRLVLELAGLSLGAITAAHAGARRHLSPAEQLWELSRQPSVIAHEVGNPLAVALGNLDLGIDAIRDATTLDPAFRSSLLQDLANATKGIDQAADYLRSIQDRPFGGVGRLGRFDASPVVRSCVTLERPIARKRGITLEWKSTIESIYLYGDASALYQVLTNLIRNAMDASQDRKGVVTISLQQAGEALRLAVSDMGDGITEEHLTRIFARGFTTKAPGKGSGIGLALVKEITESMFGGAVAVESTIGAGSTFTLTLPIPPQRNR